LEALVSLPLDASPPQNKEPPKTKMTAKSTVTKTESTTKANPHSTKIINENIVHNSADKLKKKSINQLKKESYNSDPLMTAKSEIARDRNGSKFQPNAKTQSPCES
jgi:hypothetical protein